MVNHFSFARNAGFKKRLEFVLQMDGQRTPEAGGAFQVGVDDENRVSILVGMTRAQARKLQSELSALLAPEVA